MKMLHLLYITCILACSARCAADNAVNAVFSSGTRPTDIQGNDVHAHGGCILKENGTYYWFGTSVKLPPSWISEGITVYSSPDLMTWTFVGEALSGSQINDMPYPPPFRIERPKVIYNDKMGYYVMMWHLDTPSFAYPAVGVATSETITGPYVYKHVFKPDGRDSYDMTLFKDSNGDGYLIRSVENTFLGISRLQPDWLSTEGLCASAPRSEAPAVFEVAGKFYIFSSHLTGWSPNPPMLFVSYSMCGSWEQLPTPAVGPGWWEDFDSQATYILPFNFDDGKTLFIYMGDRWDPWGPGSVANATYVWLPLIPRPYGDGFYTSWKSSWVMKDYEWAAVGSEEGWAHRLHRHGRSWRTWLRKKFELLGEPDFIV